MNTTTLFLIFSLMTNFVLLLSKQIRSISSPCFSIIMKTPRSNNVENRNPTPVPTPVAYFPNMDQSAKSSRRNTL